MRTSSRKTTAAVLRDLLRPIKVPEWAEMLNCSPHSIHDIESGRLKLSPAMALKMSYETGISVRWLMDGDPAAPPVSADGQDYTKRIYDEVQAEKESFAHVKENTVKADIIEFSRKIGNILKAANRERCYHLNAYWIGKALDQWSAALGEPTDFKTYEKLLAYVQDVWRRKEPGLPLIPPPEHARNVWKGLRKLAQVNPQLIENNPTAPKPKSKQPSKKRRR
jgi:hypothetical protein